MTIELSRAGFLRRGAVGGGALLVSASGLSTLGFPDVASAATPPDADLAYLRLLIAAELLALDFQAKAVASGKLHRDGARALARRIHLDEEKHYDRLAAIMAKAGQTPATSADIDFSYPRGTFRSRGSIVRLASRLEHLMLGAYLGAVENLQMPELRLTAAQIAANEAQHVAALAALEGRSAIGPAFVPALQMGAVSNALDEFES